MSSGEREIEIKLRVDSPAQGRRLLRAAGFRVKHRRVFEANEIFDTPAHRLQRAGTLLRLREAGGRSLVTYKGPATVGRHKSREEIETGVEDAARLRRMLDRLGLRIVFRYEKYRTEFSDGTGIATLDETPIGCFLELEGPARWIDRSARRLGFTPDTYITASYARLYLEDCARRGRRPANLIFSRRKGTL